MNITLFVYSLLLCILAFFAYKNEYKCYYKNAHFREFKNVQN